MLETYACPSWEATPPRLVFLSHDPLTSWYLVAAYASMYSLVGAESGLPCSTATQAGNLPYAGGWCAVQAAYFMAACVCSWA